MSLRRPRGGCPSLSATLLLLLLSITMINCVDVTELTSLPVTDGVPDVEGRTSSAASASTLTSSVTDRCRRLASLLRREASSTFPDRPVGLLGRRALIAFRRPAGPGGAVGYRVAAAGRGSGTRRPAVNNRTTAGKAARSNAAPAGETLSTAGGLNAPAVITSLDGVRIRTRLPSPHRPRNVILRTLSASCARSKIDGLPATKDQPDVPRQSAILPQNGSYFPQPNSARQNRTISRNCKTVAPDVGDVFWYISKLVAGGKLAEGRVPRRSRRQSEVDSANDARQPTPNGSRLNSTEMTRTQEGHPTINPGDPDSAIEPMDASLGGPVALGYRSRGNFAALVDPLHSGKARSASAASNTWLQLASYNTSSTSLPPVISRAASTSSARQHRKIFVDPDNSVDVSVLQTTGGSEANEANSTSAVDVVGVTRPFNLTSDVKSTLAPPGEWNCSVALEKRFGLGLAAALKQRLSPSAAAICVYTLSFLYGLVAACAITGIILSCVSSPTLPARATPSPLVLGVVALAAASRALYFVTAEYQPAMVAPPGCRAAIYECFFLFLLAAFVAHRYPRNADVDRDSVALAGSSHVKQSFHIKFLRDVGVLAAVICSCLALEVSAYVLISLCVVRIEAVFLLRSMLLAGAAVCKTAMCFGQSRAAAPRVLFSLLFVVYSAITVFDAASLLPNHLLLYLRQNWQILIAVEVAERTMELLISVVFCVLHTPTFSRFCCFEGRKNVKPQHSEEMTTSGGKTSKLTENSPTTRQSLVTLILSCMSKKNKSKVVDSAAAAPFQTSTHSVSVTVGWASTEDSVEVDGPSPAPLPPPPWRPRRSRSMLYNDQGFLRFRLDGDTDGESDARTLDDDDGPGQPRSAPASEYASADDLSSRRGPASSAGTPCWSRPGSPSLSGFRAPSIHLQDSIDRALDCCDIWRAGCEHGQLSAAELRRIVQLYADVRDGRRGNDGRRRAAELWQLKYAEV